MHQTSQVANIALHDPDVFARNAHGEITEAQAQAIRRMLVQSQTAIRQGSFGAIGLLFLVGFSLVSSAPLFSGAASAAQTVWAPLVIMLVLVLAAEAVLLAWLRRSWRLVQTTETDLREQRITTGVGVVAWGREGMGPGAYRMQADGHTLRSPTALSPLPPGRYRCHYLAQSGWLLSAQPLSEPADAPAGATADELALLSRLHGFDQNDLEANRAGRLSPRYCRAFRFAALGWVVIAALVGLGVAAMSVELWQNAGRLTMLVNILALLAIGTAWCGVIALLFYALLFWREADTAGPVRCATGPLSVVFQRYARSIGVYYQVGGQILLLNERMIRRHAFNSVIQGRRYRVYYRERNRSVVSLEPLE
jgi:hypothetical protein